MASSTLLLLFAVLAFATASKVSDSGIKAITDACIKAKKELECKLLAGNKTDSSVLVPPMKALTELGSYGIKDQNDIAAFGDNDLVKGQLNCSVTFWLNKMDEVIKPYVTNPKAYENLVIDFPWAPPDPTNTTKEYKDAVLNITQMVKNGTETIHKKYTTEIKNTKATNIKEVTCSTWARLQLDRNLVELLDFIGKNGQWAKQDSSNGEIETALASLKSEIDNSVKEFFEAANNICKEYKSCIKN